jgi:hypothetical protein
VKFAIAAFVAGVGQELATWLRRLDGRRVDDGCSRIHAGQRRFRHPEHCIDVGAERPVELLGRDLLNGVSRHLERRIVDKDVEVAELVDDAAHEGSAMRLVGNVSGEQDRALSGVTDEDLSNSHATSRHHSDFHYQLLGKHPRRPKGGHLRPGGSVLLRRSGSVLLRR